MSTSKQLILIAIAGWFAVIGIAQRARATQLGYEVPRLEQKRADLDKDNNDLLCEINALSHPTRIAERTQDLTVDLVNPVELTKMPLAEEKADAKAQAQSKPGAQTKAGQSSPAHRPFRSH